MAETDGGPRERITDLLTAMHRLVQHGAREAGRQVERSPVGVYPEVEHALREVQHRLEGQAVDLEQRLAQMGHAPDPAPPAATSVPSDGGSAADAIEGDQALLQHLSLEYQRLESASRAAGDKETADLAGRGYADTQYLIREQMSRATPRAARADRPRPSMNPPGVAE